MRLLAWTVDKEEDIRSMVELGVDAIASNELEMLPGILESLGN